TKRYTRRPSRPRSALDDAERLEPGDPPREPRALDDSDHALDVLVRERRLLGETLVRGAADDDPARLELAAELRARHLLARPGAAEPPAGAVAGRPEGPLERARLAREHEARRAHAAGDEHRLPDGGVDGGDLRRAGGEGARRALAVHEHAPAAVRLLLRDVVGDVVDLTRPLGHRRAEDPPDGLANGVRDRVPVRPGEVRGGGHRGEVSPALGGRLRRARELAVGEGDPVAALLPLDQPHVVGAHLVAEAARA